MTHIKTAIIPVAGRGTRFLPVTKAVAKELLPLVDTPIIHHIVEEAVSSGIKNIVFVTSKGKSALEDYFDSDWEKQGLFQDVHFICVRQHQPLGLGHAILCAQAVVQDKAFAVLLGDDVIDAETPCTKQLMDVHQKNEGAPVVAIMKVKQEDTCKYGIVDGQALNDRLTRVETLVEKPQPQKAPSCLAIPGRYILTSEIFTILQQTKPSVGGEIQLTDALQTLAQKHSLLAYQFTGQRFDAGDRLGYLEANIHYMLKRNDLRSQAQQLLRAVAQNLQ